MNYLSDIQLTITMLRMVDHESGIPMGLEYLCFYLLSLTGYAFGFGSSAALQVYISSTLLTAQFMLGGVLGSLIGWLSAKRWGLWRTVKLLHLPLILGWMLAAPVLYTVNNAGFLIPHPIAWVLIGLASGMMLVVIPTLLYSLTDNDQKHSAILFPNMALATGIWFVDFLITHIGWNYTSAIGFIAAIVGFAVISFLPDLSEAAYIDFHYNWKADNGTTKCGQNVDEICTIELTDSDSVELDASELSFWQLVHSVFIVASQHVTGLCSPVLLELISMDIADRPDSTYSNYVLGRALMVTLVTYYLPKVWCTRLMLVASILLAATHYTYGVCMQNVNMFLQPLQLILLGFNAIYSIGWTLDVPLTANTTLSNAACLNLTALLSFFWHQIGYCVIQVFMYYLDTNSAIQLFYLLSSCSFLLFGISVLLYCLDRFA